MEAVEEKKKKKQIFILSGQRNMSDRGGVRDRTVDNIVPLQSSPYPSILRFTSASPPHPAGSGEPAAEPLHADVDPSKACGVGPGMAFANALIGSLGRGEEGVAAVGLVPCAVGGTAIDEWARGSALYERMVARAKEAAGGGGGVGGGGEIRGVLWFQGESDTLSDEAAEGYGGKMERLIGDVRADLSLPSLPFIQVAIASGEERLIGKVRAAQLGIDLPNVVCVDAKGSPLNEDNIHLSTQAQVRLGQKLADAYLKHFSGA